MGETPMVTLPINCIAISKEEYDALIKQNAEFQAIFNALANVIKNDRYIGSDTIASIIGVEKGEN